MLNVRDCIRERINVSGWRSMCLAGIWQTLQGQDGAEHHTMLMITVSGEGIRSFPGCISLARRNVRS